MQQFYSIGNCAIDDVIMPDGQIVEQIVGGNALYSGVGMQIWGESVSIISVIGDDFPLVAIETLTQAGIDVSNIKRLKGKHGIRSRMYYLPDGRRTDRVEEARAIFGVQTNAVFDWNSEHIEFGSMDHRACWPLFSPSPQDLPSNTSKVILAHLAPMPLTNSRANAIRLKGLSDHHVITSLDFPWWDWDDDHHADTTLLAHVDYLLPSIEEMSMHARARNEAPLLVAKRLLELGPKAIVVKMGSQGSRVLTREIKDWFTVPVYPTVVVDPTGAGDAFCGGFLVGIARTADPFKAALYGTVSSSFIIEDFGLLHALNVSSFQAELRLRQLEQQVKLYEG